jgi:mRNA-degrading endonuclease toxin of MazEF toxin-antitoxin module
MSERGDVLQLRSQLGFGSGKGGERVVVVQATELNSALPTTLVVPLDLIADAYVDRDLLVSVTAAEAGSRKDCVAIPTHVRFVPTDRFEPGRVGRLRSDTLAELEEKLRLILDL